MAVDLFGRVSTEDDGSRSVFDFYETPRWATASLLRHHPDIIGKTVLEPCAGRDAITTVLREAGCQVLTNDLDPRHPATLHEDATDVAFWQHLRTSGVRFDYVITNAPFAVAFDILRHSYDHVDVGVANLLRKTFLEPTEGRGPWLEAHPPTRCIGLPRHQFRGDGTDSVSCDWYVWELTRDPLLPPFVVDAGAKNRREWHL